MHNKAKPGTQAKFHLRTLVIATIVILAIVLALAPSSIYEEAKAQGVGSGNKSVQGTGLLGTINCPAGTPGAISGPQPSFLSFSAGQSRGTFGGYFDAGVKTGSINNGHISGRSFTLRGIETDYYCYSFLFISTSFTLTGQCGAGTVTLKAANGETGTWSGNILCT